MEPIGRGDKPLTTLARIAAVAALGVALGLSGPTGAQTGTQGRLTVELNKLEDGETGACRAFFLFRNRAETQFEGFEMSLAILDTGGVIDRLLTIDAAPLPADRTTLKLFEIPETDCAAIGEVLLHDLPVCRAQNAEEVDCFGMLELVSRADAPLVK
jgi:hypothetical protein